MSLVKHRIGRVFELLGRTARWFKFGGLQKRFSNYTMVKQPVYRHNLELVYRFRHVPGLVVECGVWRGGMSASIATLLGPERRYFLFDSFEGLPKPQEELDGKEATRWSSGADPQTYYDNCSAEQKYATEAMRLAGVNNATLVKGWFNETLPKFTVPGPIAILRLDGDWYESTMTCLTHLFDSVTPGGLIIIDDYGIWEGCTKAVHDFLSQRKRSEPVRQWDNNLAYIVKQ